MTLRLLFDEHMAGTVADRLSEHFNVERVVEVSALGASADDEIWSYAVENDRTVVTMDRHFLDGTADPGNDTYPGVIFTTTRNSEAIYRAIRAVGRYYSTDDLADRKGAVYVPGQWI